jgi:hypothetical protein
VRNVVEDLRDDGFASDEIRRLFESQLIHTDNTVRKS